MPECGHAILRRQNDVLESTLRIEGLEHISEQAPKIADTTSLVYVAEREGDIGEFFNKNHDNQNKVDWLIRSKHNRNLTRKSDVVETKEDKKVMASYRENRSFRSD